MGGAERKNILLQCLQQLEKCGIIIECLTFDGAASNISMARNLGCSFDTENFKPYFLHPSDHHEVSVFFDVCHMLKLVRNAFGDKKYFTDIDGWGVKYSFISKLHELQSSTGLHMSNKLRAAHINYKKKIMNVKLAAQMLSDSVAGALEFCHKENIPGFEDALLTARFVRTFNRLFDIFNSRNLLASCFKAPLSSENINSVLQQLELDFKYIQSLKCPSSGKLMTSTNRKTGFLGFLIAIFNIKRLFYRLNQKILCTYKFSQDHLELFFSKIRSHCGHNNNPTALQFESSYKRLLIHNELKEVTTGNCTPLVEMSILTVSSVTQKKSIPLSKQLVQQLNRENSRLIAEEEPINFEIDQDCESSVSSNVQEHHTFYRNVVAYMAGYVVRKIRKVLNCEVCVSALTEDDSLISSSDWLHYTRFKDMGGLLYPSKDVKICIQCEKQFKANVHSNLSQINVLQL